MRKIKKILVANRGEIAVRIIRTATKMGIETVALCTPEEKYSKYAEMAGTKYLFDGDSLKLTFLNIDKIITAAIESGCDAIHPGYGFLSENPLFAKKCEESGVIFIGPDAEVISLMGNKLHAREMAVKSGLPVVPGLILNGKEWSEVSAKMEFPLLVKAVSGGGGKGMKIVNSENELIDAVNSATREAKNYFGEDSLYLEKLITNPRHIEVQIIADKFGNTVHLFERECSVQRRYQKIVEESPSPSISEKLRKKITTSALLFAKAIGYVNAGTVEFLCDSHENFYFLEMNTRIQVEHPVTELTTGIDIVEHQILIASGQPLTIKQEDIKSNGHAVECRIYAENPFEGFTPSPGKINFYEEPEGNGVRVDSGYDQGQEISSMYDPVISKLITFGINRGDAINKMVKALTEYTIQGVETNIPFLIGLMESEDFIRAEITTDWCERSIEKIKKRAEQIKIKNNPKIALIGALLISLKHQNGKNNIWEELGYWRIDKKIKFEFEGKESEATILEYSDKTFNISINDKTYSGSCSFEKGNVSLIIGSDSYSIYLTKTENGFFYVSFKNFQFVFRRTDFLESKNWAENINEITRSQNGAIFSPMPGKVIKLAKKSGSRVLKGELLFIVESMKMENSIYSPLSGFIEEIKNEQGDLVDTNSPVLLIKS